MVLILGACGEAESESEESSDENGEEASEENSNTGAEVSEAVDYTIIGIEPGAGITELINDSLDTYDNLEGWEQEESSTAGMMTTLGEAISNEEPIIVAGWNPHHMFVEYDLKYLDDPEGTMGETEDINTIAREGLEEDMPNAYQILDAFEWEMEDMETVMYEAQDGDFEEAAQSWIDDNRDMVDEWTADAEEVDGESIELVSTLWDSEKASSEVMRIVLEELGYDVEVTEVDPAIVFEAIANGDADASLAPWLPITHGSFYERHEGEFEDLGPNITGARTDLAVPEYMDIDSIEDLEPAE